jgi:hypothetical protein
MQERTWHVLWAVQVLLWNMNAISSMTDCDLYVMSDVEEVCNGSGNRRLTIGEVGALPLPFFRVPPASLYLQSHNYVMNFSVKNA